jgi:hypothetical protein
MRSRAHRIERFRASRPAYRTVEGWALGVLLEAHAIRECDAHGHMKDRTDPHALEHAREIARHDPPPGTLPDQAIAAIDDVMVSIAKAVLNADWNSEPLSGIFSPHLTCCSCTRVSEHSMAPRANWKGFLRLSLVTCPIALFPATSESEKISFNQINRNRPSHKISKGGC